MILLMLTVSRMGMRSMSLPQATLSILRSSSTSWRCLSTAPKWKLRSMDLWRGAPDAGWLEWTFRLLYSHHSALVIDSLVAQVSDSRKNIILRDSCIWLLSGSGLCLVNLTRILLGWTDTDMLFPKLSSLRITGVLISLLKDMVNRPPSVPQCPSAGSPMISQLVPPVCICLLA